LIGAQPLSPGGALLALLVAGGLLWLSLVRAVALDALDAVRRAGRAPRLPVPLHTAVTALAGGVLLAVDAMRGGPGGAGGPVGSGAATVVTAVAGPVAGSAGRAPASVSGAADEVPAAAPSVAMGVAVPGGWLPVPGAGVVP